MRVLRRAWRNIRFAFKYNYTIVTPTSIITLKHRIFRQPVVETKRTTPQNLRGRSASVVIYDEFQKLSKKQLKELERLSK